MLTEIDLLNLRMQKAMFVEICELYNSKDKKEVAKITKENKALRDYVDVVLSRAGRKYEQH